MELTGRKKEPESMFNRKCHVFLFLIGTGAALLCLMFLHASIRRQMDAKLLVQKSVIVKHLDLSDLCLFTDARYTRHPAMADRNTPFQDYPLSLEHFPSGAVMGPPPHLKHGAEN
jgi:hypothetical protein